MKCQVCNKKEGTVETEEPRYFLGKGKVCNDCFMLLASSDYDELDKLAIEKVLK